MMSQEQLEHFRRMTPAERMAIWQELANLGAALMEANCTPEEVARRWKIWRDEHERSNQNMLLAFRKCR